MERTLSQHLLRNDIEQPSSCMGGTEEEDEMLQRKINQPNWTLDRGAGYYAEERERHKRPSLVKIGRHAGQSRIKLTGVKRAKLILHMLRRELFTTLVETRFPYLLTAFFLLYSCTLTLWSTMYYLLWWYEPKCFYGFNGFVSAFLFAIETQQTIGYGVRAPGDCATAAGLVALHCFLTILLESTILGIVFTRLSHPKNRGRAIMVSECATIARRDGVLKFMCRVMDINKRQVVKPHVAMYLYTWGGGRMTHEKEYLPVRMQPMTVNNLDFTLLLPVTLEHNIDESSPLFGLTDAELEALDAEIIVIFEGSTELGNVFMVRHSYLPSEILWGYTFAPIIHHAEPGHTRHVVDLARFHDVEPQPGLEALQPRKLSKRVVAPPSQVVPPPFVEENTLVLSDDCCVTPGPSGNFRLCFRAGETTAQVVDADVNAYLYRWGGTAEGSGQAYTVQELPLTHSHVLLRFPVVVAHEITSTSPLATWTTHGGVMADANTEIVVVLKAVMNSSNQRYVRNRTYCPLDNVRFGHMFPSLVSFSTGIGARRAGSSAVDWSMFHTTLPMTITAAPAALGTPRHFSTASSEITISPTTTLPRCGNSSSALCQDYWEQIASTRATTPRPTITVADDSGSESESDQSYPSVSSQRGPPPVKAGSRGGSSRRLSASWVRKRSLFDAMEAMREVQKPD